MPEELEGRLTGGRAHSEAVFPCIFDEDIVDSCLAEDNLEEAIKPTADPLVPTANVVGDFIDHGPP